MKIKINHTSDETEVVVNGNLSDPSVIELIEIITQLSANNNVKTILCKNDGKEFLVDVEDIEYFESEGNGINAISKNKNYKTTMKLFEIESKFDNKGFVRINKSQILNLNYLDCIEVEFSGNYIGYTKNGEKLIVSRRYIKSFKKRIKERTS